MNYRCTVSYRFTKNPRLPHTRRRQQHRHHHEHQGNCCVYWPPPALRIDRACGHVRETFCAGREIDCEIFSGKKLKRYPGIKQFNFIYLRNGSDRLEIIHTYPCTYIVPLFIFIKNFCSKGIDDIKSRGRL